MAAHIMKLAPSDKLPLDVYCEHINWVFSQYAWCVPSSLMHSPDVSLLDHSLTTAAFAAALYKFHSANNSLEPAAIKDRDIKKFRLVSGDVSGIQDYLFAEATLKPRGASKRLRAKSFYIGLITQAASLMLLEDLGLPCFNRIMDAGGRFTLLIDNTSETLDKLKLLQREIDQWMYGTFHGKLRLNLAYRLECCGNDFMENKRFVSLIRKLGFETEEAKKTSMSSIFKDADGWNSSAMILKPQSDTKPEEHIKHETAFLEELGRELPKSSYLVITQAGVSNPGRLKKPNRWMDIFNRYRFNIGNYNAGPKDDQLSSRQSTALYLDRPEAILIPAILLTASLLQTMCL
jgi:CRISPR-associated protein Cas10/Csm1 subtype III-A